MTATTGVPTISVPTARIEPAPLAPGALGQLTVTIDIPEGCHIQSHAPREPFLIPTVLEIDPAEHITIGDPAYPVPDVDRFAWTPIELDVYRGRVDIEVPITAGPGAASVATITGRVRFQGCTGETCLPPEVHPIKASVDVAPTRHRPVGGRAT